MREASARGLEPGASTSAGTARARAVLVRALRCLPLLACWASSVEGWSAVVHLWALYGSLGRGLLIALLALWAVMLTLALPLSLWLAWPVLCRAVGWRARAALALALGVPVVSAAWSWAAGRAPQSIAAPEALDEATVERELGALAKVAKRLPALPRPAPLVGTRPVQCAAAPETGAVTLVATFAARSPGNPVQTVCEQAPTLRRAARALEKKLRRVAARGPVLLDVVGHVQPLASRHRWIDALKLRPGLDGVCDGGRCALPWQLLERGAFSTHRPVALIPDFQFGVAASALRETLDAAPREGLDGLLRVDTRSYALDLASREPRLTPLARLRRRDVPVSAATVERAERAAERYILGAQLPDGRFRYTLDPISGAADEASVNLARQAGTTLAVCELGAETPAVRHAIARSLHSFTVFERSGGGLVALARDPTTRNVRSGENALPLVALLACPDDEGAFTERVAGMSRLILALQREDGGFAPGLNLDTGEVDAGPEPIYAGGQAVLALVLLERRLEQRPDPRLPPREAVHAAAERAMRYFATEYWSHPLGHFFYLEENWHCLAARAALEVHRNADYERFCIDYVQFKARLILEQESGVDADFDGGFGLGNVIPPHNTGAAGFAEAMAAAIAVRRARGEPTAADERLLARVMGFLLRQQWSEENCLLCASPQVVGGMSEHTHSFLTRIDFAQHAWAGLGHGGRVLGLVPARGQ